MSDALTAALKTLIGGTQVTPYVAEVPDQLPADGAGRVKPYAVIWPSTGFQPDYARSAGGDWALDSGLEWPVQITVASGDPTWTLQAAAVVRARVGGVRLVTGAGPLTEDTTSPPLVKDPDVYPPRWFVPLLWRCATP